MGRYFVWALGLSSAVIALGATPAAAQVDIGVYTPNIGAQVVVGSPRVYVPAPVYVPPPVYYPAPVYVEPYYVAPRAYFPRDYYYSRDYYYRPYAYGFARGHYKNRFGRAYYAPYPSRVYRADVYGRPYYRGDRYGRRW